MLKKTIEYETVDGEKVIEDFYFHLSAAEIAEMELTFPGGLAKRLNEIAESGDAKLIIETFKDLISKTYGKRSEDGKRFMKDAQFWREFTETDAYSQLFLSLVTDANAAAEFVNGIVPASVRSKLPTVDTPLPLQIEDKRPVWERENRDPTEKELAEMTTEQMQRAFLARMNWK